MRLERWLHEWDVFLLIMTAGLLTGLVTYLAVSGRPVPCHEVLARAPGRAHAAWVCRQP